CQGIESQRTTVTRTFRAVSPPTVTAAATPAARTSAATGIRELIKRYLCRRSTISGHCDVDGARPMGWRDGDDRGVGINREGQCGEGEIKEAAGRAGEVSPGDGHDGAAARGTGRWRNPSDARYRCVVRELVAPTGRRSAGDRGDGDVDRARL